MRSSDGRFLKSNVQQSVGVHESGQGDQHEYGDEEVEVVSELPQEGFCGHVDRVNWFVFTLEDGSNDGQDEVNQSTQSEVNKLDSAHAKSGSFVDGAACTAVFPRRSGEEGRKEDENVDTCSYPGEDNGGETVVCIGSETDGK